MLLEARDLGRELEDVEIEGEALSWLVPSYVVLCDHDAARETVGLLSGVARRLSQPFLHHVAEHYAAALALCDGDLGATELAASRSQEWGRLLTGRDASGTYAIQMFGLRREQGRLAELAPVVRLLDADAREGAWGPGLAALYAELGMVDDARRELRRILDDGLGALRPSLWLASLVYLADACAALGDAEVAEALYPELVAYSGSNVMIGHLVACYGAMDRYLGTTAAVLGDWERAEDHFHAALALNTRLGARTWLAHTAYGYARMLLARNAGDDRSHAQGQLGLALGLAQTIGLPGLARRASELGADVEPTPALPDGLSATRGRDPRGARAGPLEPRDRPRSPHQRAHRRQPHPLDPPQVPLREPHRGGGVCAAPRPRPGLTGASTMGRCLSTSSSASSPTSST